MTIYSRYLLRNLFLGFAAAAALLLPLFSTFDFINELDDVSAGGYRWTQALLVVLMLLPRCLVDLAPFIALLGGIAGLGQLSKSLELTALRVAGLSVMRIALVVLAAGAIFAVVLSALDEWVASPLQQRAVQLKDAAVARGNGGESSASPLWARHDNEFVTVKNLGKHQQPEEIEIFRFRADLTLESYIYAKNASVQNNGSWILREVNIKEWRNGREITRSLPEMPWRALFTHTRLSELMMPGDSFSIRQLNHYIRYLQQTGQPSIEFQLALWQKPGRGILILAMVLLTVPFTFSHPRAQGAGARLAVGAIVGLLTYISYQIVINLGLLFSLNAGLTAVLPPLILTGLALALVFHFNQRH